MSPFDFCRCDEEAFARGDPFCGFCGRRISAPALSDSAQKPLPPELSWRLNSFTSAALALFCEPNPGGNGILRNTPEAPLRLASANLFLAGAEFPLSLAVIANGALQFQFPSALQSTNLRDLARLSLRFELSNARPLDYFLPLQPADQFHLRSSDVRFEPPGHTHPGTIWNFENAAAPIKIQLECARPSPHWRLEKAFLFDHSTRRFESLPLQISESSASLELHTASEFLKTSTAFSLLFTTNVLGLRASFPFTLATVPRPRLQLREPAIAHLAFNSNLKKPWVSVGCMNPVSIHNASEVAAWPLQFHLRLSPAPNSQLSEVAMLSVDSGRDALRVRAKLNPAWSTRNERAELAETVDVILCNEYNPDNRSAPPERPDALAQLDVELSVAPREPLEVLALDFGTCNTCSAVIPRLGQRAAIVQSAGEPVYPTLLYYAVSSVTKLLRPDFDHTLAGKNAWRQNKVRPGNTLFKSGLKTLLLKTGPARHRIARGMYRETGEILSDFLTIYLDELLRSEEIDGRPVKKLVCTFPVAEPPNYFERLKAALSVAIRQSGPAFCKDSAIVAGCDEASAGGLGWFFENEEKLKQRERFSVLIFDYGGGTTDLSILEFKRLPAANGGAVHWEISIDAIAGLGTCGGEDLTWRLAREFTRCVRREHQTNGATARRCNAFASPDERHALAAQVEKDGRNEWREWNPTFISMIEEKKVASVGVLAIDSIPPAVCADLLAGHKAEFLSSRPLAIRGRPVNWSEGCSPAGDFGLCRFNEWGQSEGQFGPVVDAELLNESVWLYRLTSAHSGLLHEPARAIELAKRLLGAARPGAPVDFLLLIGQASGTVRVREELKRALAGRFTEFVDMSQESKNCIAKSCVALGACRLHVEHSRWSFKPTLLKRALVWDVSEYREVLAAATPRNEIRAELLPFLQHPGTDLRAAIDCAYGLADDDDELVQRPPAIQSGYASTTKKISALVADPGHPTYALLPETLRATLERHPEFSPAHWYFVLYPEGEPSKAWVFKYRV